MAKDNNRPDKDPETTGHEWDGIKEFNNPLPRWWVWLFVACTVFVIGYVVYYPAIPFVGESGYSKGIGGWSQYKELDERKGEIMAKRDAFDKKVSGMSAEEILASDDTRSYAVAAGKALFALNCSQCHGAGAQGGKGYPNLLDDEWLWGGDIANITQTIAHGIRETGDDDARMGDMMAYGADEILTATEISDVARYIQTISQDYASNEASDRGEVIFAENCAACHGEQGEGITEFGAPPLNNNIWLYGGDFETIVETVTNGRKGQMPAFGAKFSPDEIKKLAVYVHSLGGGQ